MTKAEELEIATVPIVQAFDYFYQMHGPDCADGLIAGLIQYKKQLDREGEPLQ